ncbi:MAG: hypothetical protein V7752_04205 [Halopseudomonas sp.]
MSKPKTSTQDLFEGLKALSESAFPKTCSYCGRTFKDVQQFVHETEALSKRSGIKIATDDDESLILEVFRNCVCGSTLMDFFSDRRDNSKRGVIRRQHFSKLIVTLSAQGMSEEQARSELLNFMHGTPSEKLTTMIEKSRLNKPKGKP